MLCKTVDYLVKCGCNFYVFRLQSKYRIRINTGNTFRVYSKKYNDDLMTVMRIIGD